MRTALLVLAAVAGTAFGRCPNICSSNGRCGVDDTCRCFTGFTGPDCSERTCPEAESWAIDAADPHTHSECSNRGVCDRSTGRCECYDGFSGEACQRISCQNSCSGHGRCMMLQDLPHYNPGTTLSWDESAMAGCLCDGGYFGPDCSFRNCPFGDDPSTTCDQSSTLEQVQEVTFSVPLNLDAGSAATIRANVGFIGKEFSFRFETPQGFNLSTMGVVGAWGDKTTVDNSGVPLDPTTLTLASPLDAADQDTDAAQRIELALESLPNYAIRDVTVQHYSRSASGIAMTNKFRITFHHLGVGQNSYGAQKLLTCGIPGACAAPGCQPRVRQPYAVTIFEGVDGNTAAMSKVDTASLETLEADSTLSTGTWVKIHSDSVLSCPHAATSCGGGLHEKMYGGMNIVYEDATKEVYIRAFGSGDIESPLLNSDAGNGGKVLEIIGGTWPQRPSIARRDVAANKYKLAGILSSSNAAKFDISHIVPNSYLEFEPSIIGGTVDLTAIVLFQPVQCSVADVTQNGSPMSNPDVESLECSGRGECDRGTGKCECYEGYAGVECGVVSTIV
ncbi:hypothetical protein FNF29_03842 [Cafeteria roenbergensis]|uniref:EGF-like domain-containing protein n=1 Tax=Cafeteria roenbergensis TaxID=33653 RepID=A0A5A8CHU6_CAFRO|nr:hypothetical protein FNF29_03842 [Cafeteria roenbergensis]|eukprot:KAA0152615.1 hypothetical protein FNF29_03842 [Cafeteria roenbergensis]